MNPDNYSLKEMIQEVRNNQDILKTQSTQILAHSQSVDDHLTKLNSKVATHEGDINNLKKFQTKAMVIYSIAAVVVVSVINKVI